MNTQSISPYTWSWELAHRNLCSCHLYVENCVPIERTIIGRVDEQLSMASFFLQWSVENGFGMAYYTLPPLWRIKVLFCLLTTVGCVNNLKASACFPGETVRKSLNVSWWLFVTFWTSVKFFWAVPAHTLFFPSRQAEVYAPFVCDWSTLGILQ